MYWSPPCFLVTCCRIGHIRVSGNIQDKTWVLFPKRRILDIQLGLVQALFCWILFLTNCELFSWSASQSSNLAVIRLNLIPSISACWQANYSQFCVPVECLHWRNPTAWLWNVFRAWQYVGENQKHCVPKFKEGSSRRPGKNVQHSNRQGNDGEPFFLHGSLKVHSFLFGSAVPVFFSKRLFDMPTTSRSCHPSPVPQSKFCAVYRSAEHREKWEQGTPPTKAHRWGCVLTKRTRSEDI